MRYIVHKIQRRFFVIIFLLFLACISFFAENALPGGFLYPIKIYVNEKTMEAISLTNATRARLEIDHASRRLGEVENLAEKNKLTEETLGVARVRFNENIQTVKDINVKIKEKDFVGSSAVLSRLESSLDAHYGLLKKIENKKEYGQKLNELIEDLNKELALISVERRSFEESSFGNSGKSKKSDMEDSLKTAENRIREAEKIIATEKKNTKKDTFLAEEKLKEAIAHLAEGKAKLEIPAYADAFALFKRSEREAVAVKTLIEFGKVVE